MESPDLRVRVQPAEEFRAVAAVWDRLNDIHYRSPILDSLMFSTALREFASGRERLCVVEQGSEIAAISLLAEMGRGRWQTFQPAQLPIGAWIQQPQLSVEVIANAMLRALPGLNLALGVTQQDPQLLARPAESSRLETGDYIETARLRVRGAFEGYWQQRSSNLKQNMRKQRNRLAREGVTTRLDIVTDPEEIAAAVDEYGRIESCGWKVSAGTAVSASNAQGRFYRSALRDLGGSGRACVCRYWFNQEVVASDLCVARDGTFVVLKTTYLEGRSNFSPTMLMREEMLQRLFSEGTWEWLEFYGRAMEWHRRLTSDIRTMYHVTQYRWPFVKGMRAMLMRSRSALRKLEGAADSAAPVDPTVSAGPH